MCIRDSGILICLPTGYEDALIYKGTERAVGKVVETNNSAIITSGLIQSGEQICTLEIEGGLFKGKTLEGVNFQMCIRDRKRNRYEHQETSGNRMLQRNPSQKEPSGSRPENQDQRENLQGTEKDGSKQEKVIK